jgi:transcriptional antiterminator RfaH
MMGAEQPIVEALIGTRGGCGTVCLDQDLRIGQMVRILSGPFAHSVCRLEQLNDRGRVCVLLEIMGGQVAAYLDRSALGPAA